MSRTTAREVAMMMEFSRMLGGEDTPANVCEKAAEIGIGTLDEADVTYVGQIMSGVSEHREELDELVKKYSVDWAIERIARVDLCILRVAIFEMLYRHEDVPTGAAINEAVELAKRYGGERSYAFINGILGSVAKELAGT
ncbi:MAG TPA: transcription antitermination factor NusB [Eubacteriales bacterium]|nr:transcription antitermination factor NusB [Eubacteriales bacterium]